MDDRYSATTTNITGTPIIRIYVIIYYYIEIEIVSKMYLTLGKKARSQPWQYLHVDDALYGV